MIRSVPVRRLALIPLLATTLAACTSAPAVPVSEAQPTIVATSTATSTPIPTSTIVPTSTTIPTATATRTPTIEPTPTAVVSAATGDQLYARGAITERPYMVMIDNHPDAYPQSGMNDAAIVFEGLAEYGITRFIALYQPSASLNVGEIGPVRSTRLYFAQWAMGFHPIYAHAGGSPDGVALAESTDQFLNFEALQLPEYTWRDTRRVAPHNLYTSSKLLHQFAEDHDALALDDPEQGYLYEEIDAASQPSVSSIDYYFLDRSSRAGFRFDPETNGYYRIMRDQPHVDRVTGEQLWTRNVVVLQVDEAARVGDDKQRIDQQVVGNGAARVFRAGDVIEATWRKNSEAEPLRLYDAEDQEIVFNAGPIWIAAIPGMDRLTVQ